MELDLNGGFAGRCQHQVSALHFSELIESGSVSTTVLACHIAWSCFATGLASKTILITMRPEILWYDTW